MCNFLRSMTPARTDLKSLRGVETPCIDGFATTGDDFGYPCHNVNLLSRVGISELTSVQGSGDEELNDIWGWTAATGEEITLVGLMSSTAFVDVTDPLNPVFLGSLPARGSATYWRDIKTYKDHAYIVSENNNHGLQVIELTQMLNVDLSEGPIIFGETYHDDGFGGAHNIAINEDSGFAYIVGSDECAAGFYMMDLSTPSLPTFAGCFGEDGYVHDVQCKC